MMDGTYNVKFLMPIRINTDTMWSREDEARNVVLFQTVYNHIVEVNFIQ